MHALLCLGAPMPARQGHEEEGPQEGDIQAQYRKAPRKHKAPVPPPSLPVFSPPSQGPAQLTPPKLYRNHVLDRALLTGTPSHAAHAASLPCLPPLPGKQPMEPSSIPNWLHQACVQDISSRTLTTTCRVPGCLILPTTSYGKVRLSEAILRRPCECYVWWLRTGIGPAAQQGQMLSVAVQVGAPVETGVVVLRCCCVRC